MLSMLYFVKLNNLSTQIPVHLIRNDLRISGSVEATTDNILEGRIEIPTTSVHMNPSTQSIPVVPNVGSIWPPVADRPVFASEVRRRMQLVHTEAHISAASTSSEG